MVQIAGTYKLVKNENFVEYLTAIGLDATKAQAAAAESPDLTVTVAGDKVTLNFAAKKPLVYEYTLGKEIDEPLGPVVLKSTATINGDTLTIQSVLNAEASGTRTYKFSDSGLVVTLTATKPGVPTSTRTYKRA